ncbi:MAG: hypothetical protein ABIO44_06720, partial [Saprospiraceae bacterium]
MKKIISTLFCILIVTVIGFSQSSLINPAPGEWANFKRNLFHTGRVDKSEMVVYIDSNSNFVKWNLMIGDASSPDYTTPIIVNVAGTNYIYAATGTPGKIYCINGTNGSIVWQT